MRKRGTPFAGVLYAGLMLTERGPRLIEYNVRFGDPECQVLMARFEGDLLALLHAAATGRLAQGACAAFRDESALAVVVAARGYPAAPTLGGAVRGLDAAAQTGARIFQAGTRAAGETLVTAGGRVLAVTGTGATLSEARAQAYEGIDALAVADGFWRRDIGARALDPAHRE